MKIIRDFNGLNLNFGIGKNKYIEFTLHHRLYLGFTFSGLMSRKQDHPGFHIEATIFGIGLSLYFYDRRHWSDLKGRLLEPGEKEDYELEDSN